METPLIKVHRINRWTKGNFSSPLSRILYYTQFDWMNVKFDFRLAYIPLFYPDLELPFNAEKTWAYYRCCSGFISMPENKLGKKIYTAYPATLSSEVLRQCVAEFFKKGFMGDHCIGNPYATRDISYPFYLISDMSAKVCFGHRSLDYRLYRLEDNLKKWLTEDKLNFYGTITELETDILRTAVKKNDYNIVRRYIFSRGKRLLDMNYFSEIPENC